MDYNFDSLGKEQAFIAASKIFRENFKIDDEYFSSEEKKDEIYRQGILLMKDLSIATNGAFNLKKGIIIIAKMVNEYEELKENADLINAYNLILKNYRNLANELKINSTYDLSVMCSYLLWNGYFSKTKSHMYDIKNREFSIDYPFVVMNGGGVCYEYSILLNDFLGKCLKESSILLCKLPTNDNKMKCNYKPAIEREVANNSKRKSFLDLFLNIVTNKTGNHAVTLISENGQIYIYDLTNLSFYNVIDAKNATIVNGIGNISLKPMMSNMIGGEKSFLIEKLYGKEKYLIEDAKINEWFEKNIDLLNSNISLLNDAYDNAHPYMEIVSGGLSRIKSKKNK